MEDNQDLFHALAGVYIAGQTYSEYLALVKQLVPLKPVGGKIPKGNKALHALTVENEVRADKHLAMVGAFLKRDPLVYESAYNEVGKIQNLIYKAVRLSPRGQERIIGLIDKISKDQSEIDFWKEYEQSQEPIKTEA